MTKFNVTSIKEDVKELQARDIVFSTNNGIGYASNGQKFKSHVWRRSNVIEHMNEINSLADDFLFCEMKYFCWGWKFKTVKKDPTSATPDWLSINPMGSVYVGRVKDLQEDIKKHNEEQKPLINNWGQNQIFGYWHRENTHWDGFVEIRIYKNRTINVVLELDWDGDKKAFFCLTKEKASLMKCYQPKQPITPNQGESVEDFLKRVEYEGKERAWVPVFSDEEVEARAFNDTVKSRFIERVFGVWGGDLDEFKLMDGFDRTNQVVFTENTKKMVHDFFGYNLPENEKLKDAFNQKHLKTQDGYRTRSASDGICTLAFLESYLITKASAERKKKIDATEKSIEDIWEEFKDNLTENGLSVHQGRDILVWNRQERYIVAAYWENKEDERNYYYGSTNQVSFFVYDLKKKTRMFARIDKSSDSCDKRVPSLQNQILNYMKIGAKTRWNSETKRTEPDSETEVIYLNDLTPAQVFEGTNVAWIIQNKDQIGFNPLCLVPGNWSLRKVTVEPDWFGNTDGTVINSMYIIILATTGDKLLEQLLKSKMFRLYFLGLYGIMSAGTQGNLIFRKEGKGKSWNTQHVYFQYKNGSNLKKMLGLDMGKIKMINDQIEVRVKGKDAYDSDSIDGNYHNCPRLSTLPGALGMSMEEISRLDPVSWRRVLDNVMNNGVNTYHSYCYGNNDSKFAKVSNSSTLVAYVAKFKGNIKKVLNFYEQFNIADLDKLRDYLEMRSQMKNLQERVGNVNGERFFDEERYPEEVKKAKRFIPYIEGMTDPSVRWGDNVINTPEKFKKYIDSTFRFIGIDNDSIKYIEKGDILVGAAIKMNIAQNMNYLHDEMARWLTLYQDPAKAAAFEKAVERVSDFEFYDPESDLAIVAPKQSGDLNQEGKILSHCVASYIDPVINGTENILFIRRNDIIACPYFTMDLVPEKGFTNRFTIRQIHCYRNGNPTPEGIQEAFLASGLEVYNTQKDIIGFVAQWIKWMKDKKKIQVTNLVDHYGALCALK